MATSTMPRVLRSSPRWRSRGPQPPVVDGAYQSARPWGSPEPRGDRRVSGLRAPGSVHVPHHQHGLREAAPLATRKFPAPDRRCSEFPHEQVECRADQPTRRPVVEEEGLRWFLARKGRVSGPRRPRASVGSGTRPPCTTRGGSRAAGRRRCQSHILSRSRLQAAAPCGPRLPPRAGRAAWCRRAGGGPGASVARPPRRTGRAPGCRRDRGGPGSAPPGGRRRRRPLPTVGGGRRASGWRARR